MKESTQSDVATDSDLVEALVLASRALVSVAARSVADVAHDVTLAQYRTLIVLATRGPQTLMNLATELGVSPATATRMCDRLVKKRLVRRQHGRDDRRTVQLELSPRGHGLVEEVLRRRRREIRDIVSGVAVEDQRVMVHALRQFADAAEEMPPTDWTSGWEI